MSTAVQPWSLTADRDLHRETSRSVIRTVEWTVLCYQTSFLIFSVTYESYPPLGRAVVSLLIPVHVALLPAYIRGRGPFSLGGAWAPAGVLASFAVNGLVAWVSGPNTYGTPWVLLAGYSGGTFALLASYPWSLAGRSRLRPLFELAVFAGFFGYLLALTAWNNDGLTMMQVKAVSGAMLWPAVGYLFGKSLGQVAVVSVAHQLEVQRRDLNEFFDFLHSNVKAGIAAVRADLPARDARAHDRLSELDAAVSDYRVELVLALDQVPVAALLSERLRAFVGAVTIAETPRVGALTVPRPVGVLVGRAIGDLLTNVVVHGGTTVWIEFEYDQRRVVLRVSDDGPGFAAAVLDDESTSLHRLRQAARDLGGDLARSDRQHDGSCLNLTVPLPRPR